MPVVYRYRNCSTCRDAIKWLDARGISYQTKEIRETPPTRDELATALAAFGGNIRKLFNTSGNDYRALGLKDRLPQMTDEEALELLSGNGNLVKRPFVIHGDTALAGFRADEWEKALG